ncbi:hypothetical protein [Nocardia aobensis]|uniref:hypothetical protein n=1 Tax=Nocardia aobensis TaxID=257277 RepID=UPI0015770F97|nr:hypothetical protein [Nocardia aobensis]
MCSSAGRGVSSEGTGDGFSGRAPRRLPDGVPRTEGTEPQLQYPNEAGYYYRVLVQPPKPVWVRLDAILIRDPGTPRHVNGAGLDMTGERPGTLTHWVPSFSGEWLGRVNFSVCYADGRAPLHLTDQLVPAYALRPRAAADDPRRPPPGRPKTSSRIERQAGDADGR